MNAFTTVWCTLKELALVAVSKVSVSKIHCNAVNECVNWMWQLIKKRSLQTNSSFYRFRTKVQRSYVEIVRPAEIEVLDEEFLGRQPELLVEDAVEDDVHGAVDDEEQVAERVENARPDRKRSEKYNAKF